VAIKRAIPADKLSTRVSLKTNSVATTAHIPPWKSEALSTNRERRWVMIQYEIRHAIAMFMA
jgi:hypothetical protein